MNLFSDFITAIQDDLNVDDNSTLYPRAVIKRAVNRAYIKCSGSFNWPETEDAKKTSSQIGQEYYDYPQTWRSDSVFHLEMDNKQYGEDPDGSPMNWNDYLVWRRDSNNDSSTDKKWANQRRRYFIYPVPTTNGSYNISVWGHIVPDALVEDTDFTIWSYSMPEGNEAIVLEAVAILKSKGEKEKSGEFRSAEAKQILTMAWDKIQKEQAKYEKDQPFFDVPDYFGNSKEAVKNDIGKF
jgi:hypothetical protein